VRFSCAASSPITFHSNGGTTDQAEASGISGGVGDRYRYPTIKPESIPNIHDCAAKLQSDQKIGIMISSHRLYPPLMLRIPEEEVGKDFTGQISCACKFRFRNRCYLPEQGKATH
jgi:hypothetical protein